MEKVNNDNAEVRFFGTETSKSLAMDIVNDIFKIKLSSDDSKRDKLESTIEEYLVQIKSNPVKIEDFVICLFSSIMECDVKVNPKELIEYSYSWYSKLLN